jgi:transposase
MTRDGRSFDHRTLEAIRLMAVERVRDGERAATVIASYGFSRTTIYKWLAAAAAPGVGVKALLSRPATGRPRTLSPRQEQQVYRWINGCDPRQYGLDFGLWTRSVVAALIASKFDVRLGLTAVGELLAKLGLTPQKPLQRAYQRDPEAIERWQRDMFPAIARQANKLLWWGSIFLGRVRLSRRCGAWKDLGREGANSCCRAPWPAAIDQRGVRGEFERRFLVLHVSRRPQCGAVRRFTAAHDVQPLEAGASRGGWAPGAQDETGEGLCCLNQRDAHAPLSSRLRT